MRLFGAFVTGVVAYWALSAQRQRRKSLASGPAFVETNKHPKEKNNDQRWDSTDEAGWESFPASDPPSTW